jgi:Tfp pilus assembly pilus retraction ATPase PilT
MEPPSIDRVVETCLARGAVEIWLLAGRAPLVRFEGGVREMGIPPLTPDQIRQMLFEELAPHLAEHYGAHGSCRFDYPCRWRKDTRVRVFVLRHGDSTFATLTPIAPGTPELTYSDDQPSDAGPA